MNYAQDARIQSAWENAVVVPLFDPREIRADKEDVLIARSAYGDEKSFWGWTVDNDTPMHFPEQLFIR